MSFDDSLSDLVDRNVITTGDNAEEFRLTDRFRDALDQNHQLMELDEDELRGELEGLFGSNARIKKALELSDEIPEFVARYLALVEFLRDWPVDELIPVTILLDRFFRSPPPDEGVPRGFLSIHGDHIDVIELYSQAIVYVWRRDCDPCDKMKDSFDQIVSNRIEDIGLFAVHGPDWISKLEADYDVAAGPTTLFVVNGRVDVRLLGAHPPNVIEAEIEKIRNLS